MEHPPSHPGQRTASHDKGRDVPKWVSVRADPSPREQSTSSRSQVWPRSKSSLRFPHDCRNNLKGATAPRRTHRSAQRNHARRMRKDHDRSQTHILRPARPGLDEQVRPVLEVPEGLAPARGEEGGGVALVYSVWEQQREVGRVGRTGMEAGRGPDGGVPGVISGEWDGTGLGMGSRQATPRRAALHSAIRVQWGCDVGSRR